MSSSVDIGKIDFHHSASTESRTRKVTPAIQLNALDKAVKEFKEVPQTSARVSSRGSARDSARVVPEDSLRQLHPINSAVA